MNIDDYARKRYSTKSFCLGKTISPEKMQAIKDLLRLSPSSVNSQPWHFILADTEDGKNRIAKATQDFYSFNLKKVTDASLVIVFCARNDLDDSYLDQLIAQEEKDGRFVDDGAKSTQAATRKKFVEMHRLMKQDMGQWLAKQTYLNLGAFLLGVSTLDLDAVPIEGFDSAILDHEFSLKAKGLHSLALVSVGYHAEDDFNAKLPKSRFPESYIFSKA